AASCAGRGGRVRPAANRGTPPLPQGRPAADSPRRGGRAPTAGNARLICRLRSGPVLIPRPSWPPGAAPARARPRPANHWQEPHRPPACPGALRPQGRPPRRAPEVRAARSHGLARWSPSAECGRSGVNQYT
ncbi:hypothetical protein H696_06335, partial [Fonticula alba]